MNPQERKPLYEHNPISAGTHLFTTTVSKNVVPEGFEHEGKAKFMRYLVEGIEGIVEETSPWRTRLRKPCYSKVFDTLEEADARVDELEKEYLERGWKCGPHFVEYQ